MKETGFQLCSLPSQTKLLTQMLMVRLQTKLLTVCLALGFQDIYKCPGSKQSDQVSPFDLLSIVNGKSRGLCSLRFLFGTAD